MATVLIIDDDPDVTRLIEFALVRAGHRVLTARDWETGLAITQADHPDLVIADVMMPKLNGYEYCRRVRSQPELAETIILVFTARFQPIDRQTALEAGATDYMPKTVGPSQVVAHVEKLLRSSPAAAKVKMGTVVAIFSLRGGVGVTSLAVNLSVALALSRRQPIALLDMVPLSGHVSLMLGMRPSGSLRRALEGGAPTHVDSLKPYWEGHDTGVQVLSSPLSPSEAGEVSPSSVQPLVMRLRQAFSLAVLDLPSVLSETTLAALVNADRVLLVVTPDAASLQSAAVGLQALRAAGMDDEQLWPVLNTPGGVGGLSPEAVANALQRPLAVTIPYEPGMLTALNAGRPLMLAAPKSAAAQSIARLAGQLLS